MIPLGGSPDIKVDQGPKFQDTPQTSAAFDAFKDEAGPISGVSPQEFAVTAGHSLNIHVRVRNRGPDPASNVTVRLYCAWE